MTDVLIIEWLPRGGIPQTSEAWRRVGAEAGLTVASVGRAGSEFVVDHAEDRRLPGRLGALEAHRRVVHAAVRAIQARRPRVVYVQNYWLPFMEQAVVRAAREVNAKAVLAMHNSRPHSWSAGLTLGLRDLVRAVDEVVVHSDFVGGEVEGARQLTFVELPLPTGLLRADRVAAPDLTDQRRVALAFGVLGRAYKGAADLDRIADELGSAWQVVAAGAGARSQGGKVLAVDRFLPAGELLWLVSRADAVVLPYRRASQSAAVVLAQAVGVPPVASAVGGIPEQIDDNRTGILVEPGSEGAEWAEAIERARGLDPEVLMADRGGRHEAAVAQWLAVVSP